jgi:hypothetical protein
MRTPSVPKFKGKFKGEIVQEAFERLGPNATRKQVDQYFVKEYGIAAGCEKGMYYTARAKCLRVDPSRNGTPVALDTIGVIKALKDLANQVGGYDRLTELVEVLK